MLTQKEKQLIARTLDYAVERNFNDPLKEIGDEYAKWLASLDKSGRQWLAKFKGRGGLLSVAHPLLFAEQATNAEHALLNDDGKLEIRAKIDKLGRSFILTFDGDGFDAPPFWMFAGWVCSACSTDETSLDFVSRNSERNAEAIVKVSDYAQANWNPLFQAVRDVVKATGVAVEKCVEEDASDVRRNEARLRAAFGIRNDGEEAAK